MTKRMLLFILFVGVLSLYAGSIPAAEQERDRELTQMQKQRQTQEQIYGSQIMTEQERVEYRTKMRAAKSMEEQEQIRRENHERMKERASELGVTIPDEPPVRGPGRGSGGGMGSGGGRRR